MPYASRVPFTQINFIDVPNAVQSEISLVNTLDLKWLIKTFPAVIATYILGGDFNTKHELARRARLDVRCKYRNRGR
jgi:hypothetical protein